MGYTPHEWKQTRKVSTCNRLDFESLGSWPTMLKNFLGTESYARVPCWWLWNVYLLLSYFCKNYNYIGQGCKHGKVDNSWSMPQVQWKWFKTIHKIWILWRKTNHRHFKNMLIYKVANCDDKKIPRKVYIF